MHLELSGVFQVLQHRRRLHGPYFAEEEAKAQMSESLEHSGEEVMVQVFPPSSVSEPSLGFPQTQDFGDRVVGCGAFSILTSASSLWCRPANRGRLRQERTTVVRDFSYDAGCSPRRRPHWQPFFFGLCSSQEGPQPAAHFASSRGRSPLS